MTGRVGALARSELGRVIAFLTVWKACFFAFVFFALRSFPGLFATRGYWANFHFPTSAPPPEWIQLQTWDAQHYLYLAEYGYHAGDASTAFFPLWPLFIKAVAPAVGGSYLLSGLLLANVLSVAALALLWRLVRDLTDDRAVADTALLLSLAYPGALFFGFVYSEALFLLLAVGALTALVRDDWRIAAVLAMLLPLTRAIGFFIGVPMLYLVVREWRTTGAWPWRKALALLAPLAGLGIYFLLMAAETGSAMTGFDAQKHFISTRSISDLIDIGGLVTSLADVSFGHRFHDSLLDRLFFVLFIAALVVLWRRDRMLFFVALPLGLLPALTSFMSYTRYLTVVFPVFVAGAYWLAGDRHRHARWLVVGTLLAAQALLTVRYLNFLWAG